MPSEALSVLQIWTIRSDSSYALMEAQVVIIAYLFILDYMTIEAY